MPGVPANANPARVLNMSLGGDGGCNSAYIDAVGQDQRRRRGRGRGRRQQRGHAVGAPANCPGVIAVGGLRHAARKVGFSDLGPEIAISAPAGNCVNIDASDPVPLPDSHRPPNRGLTDPVADSAGGSIYTDSFDRLARARASRRRWWPAPPR